MITAIITTIVFLFITVARYFYKKYLTTTRDRASFRTVRGKALISACNKKLDYLNGYGIFRRYPKGENT